MVTDITVGAMGPGVPPQRCWRCGGEFSRTDNAMLQHCAELARGAA